MPPTESTKSTAAAAPPPVIIDVGKKSRKAIRLLRRGKGNLLAEVNHCIQELRSANKISGSAQPIIVVVRKKSRSIMDILDYDDDDDDDDDDDE